MRTLICRQILCIFKRVPSVKAASVQLKRDEVANDGPKLLSVATQIVGDNDATSDRKRRRRRSREIKRKRKAKREKNECIERRRIEREESHYHPQKGVTLRKG